MSALPPKADICSALAHVRFGPKADMGKTLVTPPAQTLVPLSGRIYEYRKNGPTMMTTRIIGALAFTVFVVSALAAHAQQSTDPRVADLVQSGKLRVALGLGAPPLAMKDPNTGEIRGPALDLARALARKIGVRLEPVEYPRPGAVLAGVKNNEWDVTFLVSDPARLAEADFSPPYMQSDFTYLVPASSSKRRVADMDQPGTRIAVPHRDASDLHLTQILKHAELVRVESLATAVEMVHREKVDAYAGPRSALLALSNKAPGSRVLDDGFASISFVAMVPKDKGGRITYVSDFIEEAKATGLVKQTIDDANLRGLQVAPPGRVN
jgi:polar amino acid transport system substrate-binding protein